MWRRGPQSVANAYKRLPIAGTAALATAGLPGVVVNPRQARDFARATEQLAQTEALEAGALTHGANVIRSTPRPLPDAQTRELRAFLGRRQSRMVMRTAAPHRLTGTNAYLTQAIEAHIAWLNARLATLDNVLETLLWTSSVWRAHDDLLQSVPGIGPGWARTLWRQLREWGPRTRQQTAAWVAPSRAAVGPCGGGGRLGVAVRTVLSLGTLVATRYTPWLKASYERLLAAGKIKKVALTAGRRQFLTICNVVLKHRTLWQAQEVPG